MDAREIIYTGTNLTHLGLSLTTNVDLDTILHAVDTHITGGSSPDYSGYNLYCVVQTDGHSHPTNTQNFAEGISKVLCDLVTAYNAFVGTTYVANQGTITSALNNLTSPGLTYSPFSITNTDTISQVYTKLFSGFTAMTASITPAAANWSTLSISTQSTIVNAFNAIIAYEVGQDTLITGKQASLGTFNTTAIGGGSGTAPVATITNLISYTGALPTYDSSSITWGCVSAGGTLQTDINNIIAKISLLSSNYIADSGTGITKTLIGSCLGYRVSVDPAWVGLFKVAVDVTDAGTTPGYLSDKLESLDSSITITNTGSKMNLVVASPANGKVKVNSSDTADYLETKLVGNTSNSWGLAITTSTNNTNNKIIISPTVNNPDILGDSLLDYILSSPALLLKFGTLVNVSGTTPGLGIINLVTAIVGASSFSLTWTPQSGISQNAKWRIRGNSQWNTSSFSVPNPLSSGATTTNLISGTHNVPYQLQVDTIYASGLAPGNIREEIIYNCITPSHSIVAGVISLSQPVLTGIDIVEYNLYNSGPTLLQTITVPGGDPGVSFTSVASGTYSVKFRYGTMINGVTLYSDDPSQINAFCTVSGLIVP